MKVVMYLQVSLWLRVIKIRHTELSVACKNKVKFRGGKIDKSILNQVDLKVVLQLYTLNIRKLVGRQTPQTIKRYSHSVMLKWGISYTAGSISV